MWYMGGSRFLMKYRLPPQIPSQSLGSRRSTFSWANDLLVLVSRSEVVARKYEELICLFILRFIFMRQSLSPHLYHDRAMHLRCLLCFTNTIVPYYNRTI